MPMRLSGLMSGMDTESIIQQLVEAKKTKVTKAVKAQKSLKYKQDAWKDLNKQIVNLYNKSLTTMRFQSSYMKKVTKVSNSNVVSVITGETAMNSVQSLTVDQLAKSGYLTGGQIGVAVDSDGKGVDKNNKAITSSTKLSDLGFGTGTGSFRVKTADGVMDISVDGDSTIGGFIGALKDAGLNANFDEANGRIHITSKGSGTKNDFSIIANDAAGWSALDALGLDYKDAGALDHYVDIFGGGNLQALLNQKPDLMRQKELVDEISSYLTNTEFKNAWDAAGGNSFNLADPDFEYNKLSKEDKQKFDDALSAAVTAAKSKLSGDAQKQLEELQSNWNENKTKLNGTTNTLADVEAAVNKKIDDDQKAYLEQITALRKTLVEEQTKLKGEQAGYLEKIKEKVFGTAADPADSAIQNEWNKALQDANVSFNVNDPDFDYNALDKEEKDAFEKAMQQAFNKAYELKLQDGSATDEEKAQLKEELEGLNADWNTTVTKLNSTESSLKSLDEDFEFDATDGSIKGLSEKAKQPIIDKITNAVTMYDKLNVSSATYGAFKNDAADAKITLNGVDYTSSKNTFEVNGLTLTVSATTAEGESVTITTEDDTNGIYDMVKNFFKEYNAVINQMDKLYNADAAKGYEPLTDEEKEAMSDSQIEEWENKIKDAALRKDGTLSTFASEMKRIMMEGVEVDGKKMYLANFGIGTLNYFVAADNERNAYHIDGDPDDENTANNPDKLKSMIANDPDTVVSFFTQLSQKMSDKMFDMMKSVEGVSSAMTAYEDKRMQTDYDNYTAKIKELEKKLADYEDKWYAKFAAMETALAKMQNNASAVTSLLGG